MDIWHGYIVWGHVRYIIINDLIPFALMIDDTSVCKWRGVWGVEVPGGGHVINGDCSALQHREERKSGFFFYCERQPAHTHATMVR